MHSNSIPFIYEEVIKSLMLIVFFSFSMPVQPLAFPNSSPVVNKDVTTLGCGLCAWNPAQRSSTKTFLRNNLQDCRSALYSPHNHPKRRSLPIPRVKGALNNILGIGRKLLNTAQTNVTICSCHV